jgi:hypothetical protein
MPSQIWCPIWLVSSFYPIPDVEMAGVVQELRGGQEYLAMLRWAEDMDIDGELEEDTGESSWTEQQQQSVVVNARGLALRAASVQIGVMDGAGDRMAAGAGAVGGAVGACGSCLLLVVLDTNILLMKEGLGLLKNLEGRQNGSTTAVGKSEGGGGRGCKVVFVVPYIVLVELDNLKGRQRDAGKSIRVTKGRLRGP